MSAWVYLKQHWTDFFSSCALVMSIVSLRLSYLRFHATARPVLYLKCASAVEIENIGPVAAVDICLALIERVKRPSGRLSAPEILNPGGKSNISAYQYPETVTKELPAGSFEEKIMKLEGQEGRSHPSRIARHLLLRDGRQLLVVRYRPPDGTRQIVRLFSVARRANGFSCLKQRPKVLVAFRARFFEWRYRHNSELAPPPNFAALLASTSVQEKKNDK
jgi:hypothetical protein